MKLDFSFDYRNKLVWIFGFIAIIWGLAFVNLILGHRLDYWGLYPRTAKGIVGIFLSPFLHYGFRHVFANTVPFIVLGLLVIARGVEGFLEVSAFIILVSGLAVWLVGRPAYHIGASGLIMGYIGFLLARGWYDRSPTSILTALFVLMLYGGSIWSIFPGTWWVSWEMHLFGFLSGILAASLLSHRNRTGRNRRLRVMIR